MGAARAAAGDDDDGGDDDASTRKRRAQRPETPPDSSDNDRERTAHRRSVTSEGKRRAPPSVADSDAKSNSDGAVAPRKVRKSTHIVRKEEKKRLLSEMAALQARLRGLEEHHAPSLRASRRSNALLRESVRSQQLSLATAQCAVSGLLNGKYSNPLSTACIRLGTDWNERRRTLLAAKDRAIRHACEYVDARSKFLDPLKRHVSEERFENTRGDYCCARYEVRQFADVGSVKQVYDALLTYLHSIEISVSERLGDITTRDDFDFVEGSVASYRFLSTEFGVPVEKQDVMFMQYFESHELSNGEPCGVVVVDSVDEDELFPRKPYDSVRKDSSVMVVLTPHWRASAGGGGKELVVTMSIGRYIKLHHSECPLATPAAIEKMRDNIMGWGEVLVASMHDVLYRNPQ